MVTSCEDDNTCGITERSDDLFVQFFNFETKQLRTVDFDTVSVVFGEEVFSLTDTTASILPVDVNSSVTNFTFHTDSIDYDFQLSYRSEILIENEKCDPVFRIFALEGSSVELDSIVIKVFELTNRVSPHVEIYF